ncbi:hypothetical protein NA78x_006140 [Anatilimnocola sp. NA78]|uniref:hypothetical protein n=1 Tax=Anatilimnocola sp. NA78 TaxID=3415683 RepID=UPI003CE495D8
MFARTNALLFLLAATSLTLPSSLLAQAFVPPGSQVPGGSQVPAGTLPLGQPAPPPVAAAEDPTVVGRMEHLGWSLTGPHGRHYIFGGLAIADYQWQGKRRIVTLQEQAITPEPDPEYLFYSELREGHWWAFRKKPWPDNTYSVWFRPKQTPPSKWIRLQRSTLQMPTLPAQTSPRP